MSDSDSDSHSSMGEAEGACGKLLEEIAQQEQVAEVSFHTVQFVWFATLSFCRLIQLTYSLTSCSALWTLIETSSLMMTGRHYTNSWRR